MSVMCYFRIGTPFYIGVKLKFSHAHPLRFWHFFDDIPVIIIWSPPRGSKEEYKDTSGNRKIVLI